MENKKKVVAAGSCPVCNGKLHYSGSENHDGRCVSYDWICDDCGEQGTEYHELRFVEHYVKNQDAYYTEGLEIENKKKE